ncbi:MAG TPA: IDEAL domain-containing protein [Bacillota bacterium]|nr:IDEAL domain-containing protein [Bacillota bacterium]
MKNKQIVYRYYRYDGKPLQAKREIPYDIKITSRLLLDELCFKWNKEYLTVLIDEALDHHDEAAFRHLSKKYGHYFRE